MRRADAPSGRSPAAGAGAGPRSEPPSGSTVAAAAVGSEGQPHATLGLREAIAIIVGIVIGAGIFKAPSLVAMNVPSEAWLYGAWLLGGLVSLIGALCYAELATAFPSAGGDYHFLHRAFGRHVSFLFAWARFSVITTGSIALLAFVFGDYMTQLAPLGAASPVVWAVLAIVVLTWVNVRGVRAGTRTQSWLTSLEVLGLVMIVVAGVVAAMTGAGAGEVAGAGAAATAAGANAAAAAPAASAPTVAAFGMAMVFVLLTYGGWNEAAYIGAELRDEKRNMVRALLWSIAIITSLYVLVNWAYLSALGLGGMAASKAVAADTLAVSFGSTGRVVIAAMVAIAALTSINATMIVGARTTYSLGRDWSALGVLGRWDEARGTPVRAMLAQGGVALALVVLGLGARGGFTTMVEYTAPVFWLFFLLSGVSLLVLRVREPMQPRPFRVPLYPVLPLLFISSCAYMLWSSLSYVRSNSFLGINAAWIGVAVLASGVVLAWVAGLAGRGPGAAVARAPDRRA